MWSVKDRRGLQLPPQTRQARVEVPTRRETRESGIKNTRVEKSEPTRRENRVGSSFQVLWNQNLRLHRRTAELTRSPEKRQGERREGGGERDVLRCTRPILRKTVFAKQEPMPAASSLHTRMFLTLPSFHSVCRVSFKLANVFSAGVDSTVPDSLLKRRAQPKTTRKEMSFFVLLAPIKHTQHTRVLIAQTHSTQTHKILARRLIHFPASTPRPHPSARIADVSEYDPTTDEFQNDLAISEQSSYPE